MRCDIHPERHRYDSDLVMTLAALPVLLCRPRRAAAAAKPSPGCGVPSARRQYKCRSRAAAPSCRPRRHFRRPCPRHVRRAPSQTAEHRRYSAPPTRPMCIRNLMIAQQATPFAELSSHFHDPNPAATRHASPHMTCWAARQGQQRFAGDAGVRRTNQHAAAGQRRQPFGWRLARSGPQSAGLEFAEPSALHARTCSFVVLQV